MERRPGTLIWFFFAFLTISAPLLYGAVDRSWQAFLLVVFGLALVASPLPALRPTRAHWLLAGGFVALLVLKEFVPVSWFGAGAWRDVLVADYGLAAAGTRNPTPALALDLLAVMCLAAVWTWWVRGLSGRMNGGAALPLILLAAAAALAAVSLWMKAADPDLIYGVRLVRGWQKFGPFPNRNHAACVLAMGFVLGAGCAMHFFRRKDWPRLVFAAALSALVMAGLLASESRGALLACGVGLLALLGLSALRSRRASAIAVAAAIALLFVAGVLASRAEGLGRLLAPEETDKISAFGRVDIWLGTVALWRDAPLLGQGMGTFVTAFPFFKTANLDNSRVLHPESAWLLWLSELGLLPLLLAVAFFVLLLKPWLRGAAFSDRSFGLRAGGLCAFLVLVVHSAVDVPAGRWAAGAFGLAALALACPVRDRPALRGGRWAGIAVVALAIFWLQTLWSGHPGWTPAAKERILVTWTRPDRMTVGEIDRVLAHFPFDLELHQIAGFYKVGDPILRSEAWAHFQVINRLLPDSWLLPQQQAMLAAPHSPAMALSLWVESVDRAGERSGEVLLTAWAATKNLEGAEAFWQTAIAGRPALAPVFAGTRPAGERGEWLALWIDARAGAKDLKEFEITRFYALVGETRQIENLRAWMAARPELESRDHRVWARLLQEAGFAGEAWAMLSKWHHEPDFPELQNPPSTGTLARNHRMKPDDWLNAQTLASALARDGNQEESDRIIRASAALEGAPVWFRLRAAHAAARTGHPDEAIRLLLREGE